ncbi:MAG TPA: hypothetical protein DCP37_16395, partial [Dehalococcoidia bacterium]|nr:hypothetical protein [Dehalococcoidia bacterium]
MPCSNCGKENPSQARFCMFCANPCWLSTE